MKLKLNLMRVAALCGLAVSLLASCGGGTQIEAFVPNRIVVFGDEASLIEPDPAFPTQGKKRGINGVEVDSSGALTSTRSCFINQIWVQQLAYNYGFSFPECATTGYAPAGVMRAEAGGTVAMMSARISAFAASPGFTNRDLVTVMAGTHDIIAALAAPNPGAAAEAAGRAFGEEVVRITNLGAKVIVSTVPDVGSTPYGQTSGQTQLLSTLTAQFNTALRLKLQDVRGGGHSAGLVLADELVLSMTRFPATYGVTNLTEAACLDITDCDQRPALLDPDVSTTTRGGDWLWAGPQQLGPNAQARLGAAAYNRARNNPF